MNTIDKISDKEIGERLRIAREAKKITQLQAAKEIDVARTTLVAIEQGQRHARIDEIQKLSSLYQISANSILRNEAVHLEMSPLFRKLKNSEDKDADEAFRLLESLVKAEVELENALGIKRITNYPPERPIRTGNVKEQAELDAQEFRNWLGIGVFAPIVDIISILDLQIGVRVYIRELPSKISGLFACDKKAGACMLLNAKHPRERIQQSAAHETGHFISTREYLEVLFKDEDMNSREEMYADYFGRCFLTPRRAVQDKFAELTAGQTNLTRRHIIIMANYFNVSREAITRRLEELGLVKPGTWDWFVDNGGITDEQVKEVLGASSQNHNGENSQGILPPRLLLMVQEAWKKDLYSEGQLAELLSLDRYKIRDILADVEEDKEDTDGFFKLPQ